MMDLSFLKNAIIEVMKPAKPTAKISCDGNGSGIAFNANKAKNAAMRMTADLPSIVLGSQVTFLLTKSFISSIKGYSVAATLDYILFAIFLIFNNYNEI